MSQSWLQSLQPDDWTGSYYRYAGIAAVSIIGLAVPFVVTESIVFLLTWILTYGILTLGYNVLYGYTGLLSFGHAAFFGGGAYIVALTLEYTGIQSILLLLLLAVVGTTVLGMVLGAVALRSTDIYYSLLTLALAQIVYVVVYKSYDLTGGSDGITISRPTFLGQYGQLDPSVYLVSFYYYFILIVFAAVVASLWVMLRSPFGLTLKAIRENETRTAAIGLPVKRYKWYSMIISAALPGLAGGLYAILFTYISPSLLFWTMSGDILFMTLFGGAGTFIGPVFGGAFYILLRRFAAEFVNQHWQSASRCSYRC